MARIAFSSTGEEILGKLAGSIFQDSYGGYQVRGFYRPKNPQTQLQQLRRGDFRYLAAGWRNLSSPEQLTWINQAGTVPEALRLYIGSNINLNLIGLSIVSSYTAATTPATLPLVIVDCSDTVFTVQSSTLVTTVPAGQKLLLFATFDNSVSALFNNPSAYQPIIYFDEGTNFSSAVNIFSAWSAHYGLLRLNRHVCIKNVLIDKTNGSRGADVISCAISTPVVTDYLINSDGTFIIDSDGTFIVVI